MACSPLVIAAIIVAVIVILYVSFRHMYKMHGHEMHEMEHPYGYRQDYGHGYGNRHDYGHRRQYFVGAPDKTAAAGTDHSVAKIGDTVATSIGGVMHTEDAMKSKIENHGVSAVHDKVADTHTVTVGAPAASSPAAVHPVEIMVHPGVAASKPAEVKIGDITITVPKAIAGAAAAPITVSAPVTAAKELSDGKTVTSSGEGKKAVVVTEKPGVVVIASGSGPAGTVTKINQTAVVTATNDGKSVVTTQPSSGAQVSIKKDQNNEPMSIHQTAGAHAPGAATQEDKSHVSGTSAGASVAVNKITGSASAIARSGDHASMVDVKPSGDRNTTIGTISVETKAASGALAGPSVVTTDGVKVLIPAQVAGAATAKPTIIAMPADAKVSADGKTISTPGATHTVDPVAGKITVEIKSSKGVSEQHEISTAPGAPLIASKIVDTKGAVSTHSVASDGTVKSDMKSATHADSAVISPGAMVTVTGKDEKGVVTKHTITPAKDSVAVVVAKPDSAVKLDSNGTMVTSKTEKSAEAPKAAAGVAAGVAAPGAAPPTKTTITTRLPNGVETSVSSDGGKALNLPPNAAVKKDGDQTMVKTPDSSVGVSISASGTAHAEVSSPGGGVTKSSTDSGSTTQTQVKKDAAGAVTATSTVAPGAVSVSGTAAGKPQTVTVIAGAGAAPAQQTTITAGPGAGTQRVIDGSGTVTITAPPAAMKPQEKMPVAAAVGIPADAKSKATASGALQVETDSHSATVTKAGTQVDDKHKGDSHSISGAQVAKKSADGTVQKITHEHKAVTEESGRTRIIPHPPMNKCRAPWDVMAKSEMGALTALGSIWTGPKEYGFDDFASYDEHARKWD